MNSVSSAIGTIYAKYGKTIPVTTHGGKCLTVEMVGNILSGINSKNFWKAFHKGMSGAVLDSWIHNYYRINSSWWYREWCHARICFQSNNIGIRLWYETAVIPQCKQCGSRSDMHHTYCMSK